MGTVAFGRRRMLAALSLSAIALTALAQDPRTNEAVGAARDWLAFLDKHAFETLTILGEQIVPGSRAAKVPEFLDRLLAVESTDTQKRFVQSIGEFERQAREAQGKPWKALTAPEATAILTKMSEAPGSEGTRRAFETIKGGVAETYFATEAGLKELGWNRSVMFASPIACG